MKRTDIVRTVIIVTFAILAGPVGAQEANEASVYLSVDCMKSTSPDYVKIETEIWQPMHQALVDRGQRRSWALYRVMFGDRSQCDYYTVTTYSGEAQLNSGMPIQEVFERVHRRRDYEEQMARTWSSRQNVASELWVMVDSTAINAHRYATVNKMLAEDPDVYMRMETRVFKPGHQVLLEDGFRAGWAIYELVTPIGTSVPYNFATVDFGDGLGPVPMAEAMLAANPGRDIDEMADMLALREHVSSETWVLVASTEISGEE